MNGRLDIVVGMWIAGLLVEDTTMYANAIRFIHVRIWRILSSWFLHGWKSLRGRLHISSIPQFHACVGSHMQPQSTHLSESIYSKARVWVDHVSSDPSAWTKDFMQCASVVHEARIKEGSYITCPNGLSWRRCYQTVSRFLGWIYQENVSSNLQFI